MTAGNSSTPSPPAAASGDVFDELAALYLTGPSTHDEPAQETSAQGPAFRELLLVGNLPVRGGLWLTPYADAIAREHGTTALVRLDLLPPTLELLRAERSPFSKEKGELSFQQAVQSASDDVAVWIVRAPTSVHPSKLINLAFDRITVLSGNDSAAIIAAYQIIKQLVHIAQEADVDLPPIGLALVGAGEVAVVDIMERINATSGSQLGIEIELAGALPRMDSGIRCETFASFRDEPAPAVEDVLDWIDEVEDAQQWTSSASAEAVERTEDAWPQLRLAPLVEEDEPERPERQDSFVNEPTDARDSAAPMADAIEEVKLAPKPIHVAVDEGDRKVDATHVESLIAFVDGLLPLTVRHPEHGHIELAADQSGGVHVLAREASLREIRIVEHWARAHRNIIALACKHGEVDPKGEVTAHVFTDEPSTLADLHGTGLRLHVLAPVSVMGRTTWYAAPLNR